MPSDADLTISPKTGCVYVLFLIGFAIAAYFIGKRVPQVLDVLKRSTIAGNVLTLPDQLSRPLYEQVAKVITNCGGKWAS